MKILTQASPGQVRPHKPSEPSSTLGPATIYRTTFDKITEAENTRCRLSSHVAFWSGVFCGFCAAVVTLVLYAFMPE